MAQIIKHRRGSIGSLKSTTARNAELIIASGSISDLSGPFVFIGSPNTSDEGVAGAFNTVSKLYTGTNAPTIVAATYGSGLDGTPFYASNDKSLYILNNSNVGNTKVDLTGNIEGNVISGVTINNLTGTTATFETVNLSTISFTGLTEGRVTLVGPGGSLVDSGSLNYNNNELGISGSIKLNSTAYLYNDGALFLEDHDNGVEVQSNNWVDLQSNDNYVYLENGYNEIYSSGNTDIYGNGTIQIYANTGNLDMYANDGTIYLQNNTTNGEIVINARNGGTTYINTAGDQSVGDVYVLANNGNQLYVQGNTHLQSTVYIDNTLSMYHDGTFYIEDTDNTGIEMLSSAYTKIRQQDDTAHFYTSNDYAEMYGNGGLDVYTNSGDLWVYNNSGTVWLSAYDGGTLKLNADGGEGEVRLGNGNNNFYTNNVIAEVWGSNYAELASGNEYIWAENGQGAFLQAADGTYGFSVRTTGEIEVTGSLHVNGNSAFTGSVNITGDTAVTGTLVVTDGAAFIDQGLSLIHI